MGSKDLVAMIDFLYFGEANVYQENLDSFLSVAQELQLKGLMGSGAEEEEKGTMQKKSPKPVQKRTYAKQEFPTHNKSSSVERVENSTPLEGTVAVTDFTVVADLQDLDVKIKSMMESTEKTIVVGNRNQAVLICKVCGKEGQMADIQRHIEAHHITGVSRTCNVCGTTTRSRHAMSEHKRRNHTLK